MYSNLTGTTMALLSIKEYTGDGATTDFTFDIPYLATTDVYTFVDGVLTAHTIVSPTVMRISPAPVDLSTVQIKRLTSKTPAHTYPNPTTVKSDSLNNNQMQAIYLAEENTDLMDTTPGDVILAATAAGAAAASATEAETSATDAETAQGLAEDAQTAAELAEENTITALASATIPRLIYETELVSSTSTKTLSPLALDTHKSYRIEIDILNGGAAIASLNMFAASDTIPTNYYTQKLEAANAAVTATRSNNAQLGANLRVGSHGKVIINLSKDKNDFLQATYTYAENTGENTQQITTGAWGKITTLANLTFITLTSGIASGIGTGTTIRIYRGD